MTIALIVLGVIVLGLILWFFGAYNGLIKLRNLVEEAWAQIDVERGTLEAVTQARAAAMAGGQSPAATAKSEAALTQALVRLNAVAEAYPDLKANANFSALQAELGATEDRIASARRYYNANVRELNTKVESIPTNFVAGPAGVHKAEYFELDAPAEREAPKVSFDPAGSPQLPPAAPAPAPVQDAPAYPQTPPPPAPGSPWGQPPTTPQS